MRKISSSAALLLCGLSTSSPSAQVLNMFGSDTLAGVTQSVIAACGLSSSINYIGGGSSAGQQAMLDGHPQSLVNQHVAPMTRKLRDVPFWGNPDVTRLCAGGANNLLIGLDAIAVVGANHPGSEPSTCSDDLGSFFTLSVPGCGPADGCTTPGSYTFRDWRDVLVMLYGGLNNNTSAGPSLIPLNNFDEGSRNPVRINCDSPVRRALVNSPASIFGSRSCNGTGCSRINHAFRRDDLSGITDSFVSLLAFPAVPADLSLPAIPEFARSGFGGPDSLGATANPFCNAGTARMNKGDADYLDLDPIRRPCKFTVRPVALRANIEDVCEGYASPNNSDASCPSLSAPPPAAANTQIERSASNGRGLVPFSSAAILEMVSDIRRQGCLGFVIPISIPQNIPVANLYPAKICTPGGFRALAIPAPRVICPNGLLPPCALPAVDNGPGRAPSFDCISDSALPGGGGISDARVFNTFVLSATGQVIRDDFNNPNFVNPAEARIVRAFFRLHTNHVDNSSRELATGGPCRFKDENSQMGCLVKASPCSIGFASRSAVDRFSPFQNFGFQISGIPLTDENIDGVSYPLTHGLWFNDFEIAGWDLLTPTEVALHACFSNAGIVDPLLVSSNFRPVPANLPRIWGCPGVLP